MKDKWTAREIELAVTDWLLERGHTSVITHFYPDHWHECDVYGITAAGYGIEVEVKISVADFRADFKKEMKHEVLHEAFSPADRAEWHSMFSRLPPIIEPSSFKGCPRRYYFAVPESLINVREVPSYAGLLCVRWYGPPEHGNSWYRVTVAKPAPALLAAKKVTPHQLRKLSVAYKFHYYTLLRKLVEVQR